MRFEGYNGRINVEDAALVLDRTDVRGRFGGDPGPRRISLEDVQGAFLQPPEPRRPGYLQLLLTGSAGEELTMAQAVRSPDVVTFTAAQQEGFERLHEWLEYGGDLVDDAAGVPVPSPVVAPPSEPAGPSYAAPVGLPVTPAPASGGSVAVSEPPPRKSWFLRHKILTALATLFVLGLIGSLTDSGESPAKQNDALTAATTSAPAARPTTAPSTVDPAAAARASASAAAAKKAADKAAAKKAAEEKAAAKKAAEEQAAAEAAAKEAAARSAGQQNALESAENYLSLSPFSRSGLIKQLVFEDYSTSDATYAVDHVDADWNAQAAKAAKNYLDLSSFSHSGLVKQLTFEGYTQSQAEYGVRQAGL